LSETILSKNVDDIQAIIISLIIIPLRVIKHIDPQKEAKQITHQTNGNQYHATFFLFSRGLRKKCSGLFSIIKVRMLRQNNVLIITAHIISDPLIRISL